jgi:hypothetical protein
VRNCNRVGPSDLTISREADNRRVCEEIPYLLWKPRLLYSVVFTRFYHRSESYSVITLTSSSFKIRFSNIPIVKVVVKYFGRARGLKPRS